MNRVHAAQSEPGQPPLAELFEQQALFRAPKTILLAEDDDDLRYVMEYTLTSMGYSVVAAADAYLASAAFRTHPLVDILLTDYEMPGRNGLDLARELTGLRPSLPVMINTGSILQAATLTEMNDRKWTYISKPCHLGALEVTLKRLLEAEDEPIVGMLPA